MDDMVWCVSYWIHHAYDNLHTKIKKKKSRLVLSRFYLTLFPLFFPPQREEKEKQKNKKKGEVRLR